jgi:hypothetical protein
MHHKTLIGLDHFWRAARVPKSAKSGRREGSKKRSLAAAWRATEHVNRPFKSIFSEFFEDFR